MRIYKRTVFEGDDKEATAKTTNAAIGSRKI
jgi:hypothetical protein